jgi:ribonuclease T2
MDIMPSKKLIIHEYRKHGTCSGLAPFAYFEFARKEFEEIKIPDRYVNPFESQFVSPGDLVDQFLEVNPSMKPEMIAVSCGGAGNRLKEIRICLTKTGEPTACGENENAKRMCRASQMFVPPVRSSRVGAETSEARELAKPKSPLPMPRVIPWGQ